MPKVEIELTDDGKVIGSLPDPIQVIFNEHFNEAFKKGAQKAEAKFAGIDPVERERLKALELENSKLKEADALRQQNYEEAARQRDERYHKDLAERDARESAMKADLETRTRRIHELAAASIRLEAVKQGARPESLPELDIILSRRIGLNERLEAIVLDGADASKPALDDTGKPVTVEGLVHQYLAQHPHHKAASNGRGGNARGGASMGGHVMPTPLDAALAQVAKEPTLANQAATIAEIRKLAAS